MLIFKIKNNIIILLINDFSRDETEDIIRNLQLTDSRIKLVNHYQNLGVYHSRIEAILNAKGEYILLMDPDDMYLNPNLFQEIYNYNLKYNLDIIEFSVFQQNDGEKKIFLPDNHYETHYHGFPKDIISQPELSNLLYYLPGTNEYSKTICRNIWNKIIRRKVFLKVDKYIGKDYYDAFVITADDMIMNLIAYQYAQNYSNIILPGYLYNIRIVSMSRGEGGVKLKRVRASDRYEIEQALEADAEIEQIEQVQESINIATQAITEAEQGEIICNFNTSILVFSQTKEGLKQNVANVVTSCKDRNILVYKSLTQALDFLDNYINKKPQQYIHMTNLSFPLSFQQNAGATVGDTDGVWSPSIGVDI